MPDDPKSCETDGFYAWLQLVRVYHHLQRRIQAALEPFGVTLAQLDVLYALSGGDDITQQELAERLLMTKANVAVILDRLADRGLIERRSDPRDRRANRLFLTPAARGLLADALPVHADAVVALMRPLPDDSQLKLRAALDELAECLTGT